MTKTMLFKVICIKVPKENPDKRTGNEYHDHIDDKTKIFKLLKMYKVDLVEEHKKSPTRYWKYIVYEKKIITKYRFFWEYKYVGTRCGFHEEGLHDHFKIIR